MSLERKPQIYFDSSITGMVRNLILFTVTVFLFQTILRFTGGLTTFDVIFGLVPDLALKKLFIWQFLTYLFLHGGVFHILFNMLCLWWFGSSIENVFGSSKFLEFYLITGAGAGLFVCLLSLLTVSDIPVIGASGAVFAVLAAYGTLFPDNIIMVFFLFPMKAKYAVLIFGLIELYTVLISYGYQLGAIAHVSGMGLGYLYVKKYRRSSSIIETGKEIIEHRKEMKRKEKLQEKARFYHEEIDPILEKISKEGLDSLTSRERKILEKAKHFRDD